MKKSSLNSICGHQLGFFSFSSSSISPGFHCQYDMGNQAKNPWARVKWIQRRKKLTCERCERSLPDEKQDCTNNSHAPGPQLHPYVVRNENSNYRLCFVCECSHSFYAQNFHPQFLKTRARLGTCQFHLCRLKFMLIVCIFLKLICTPNHMVCVPHSKRGDNYAISRRMLEGGMEL